MELVDLNRYELTGLLGSGADYEVRAAVDQETGAQVVIKRPAPQMISRRMHLAVETRTDRTLQVYEELGNAIPQICSILGYTERANHDEYFGESLGQEYRIMVAQRAAGIPLAGDPRSRILRVPIGLGQNLFCLYPLGYLNGASPFPVQQQLLDAEERFFQAGYVLLDMGPQNIFFQPANGRIAIIDAGALLTGDNQRATGSRGPQDIHDFYLETLKFYTTLQEPPTDVAGYRDPYGLRPVVNFEQELEEMARHLSNWSKADETAARDAGLHLIDRVRSRSYADFPDFRRDLTDYLAAIQERNRNLTNLEAVRRTWSEALRLLREEHWQKYIFDPETDLAGLTTFNTLS